MHTYELLYMYRLWHVSTLSLHYNPAPYTMYTRSSQTPHFIVFASVSHSFHFQSAFLYERAVYHGNTGSSSIPYRSTTVWQPK
jgi:hypothetical protein